MGGSTVLFIDFILKLKFVVFFALADMLMTLQKCRSNTQVNLSSSWSQGLL